MNAGSEAATKCEAVFKKCDASHDWTPDEAVALLDEIETVARSRAEWTLRINSERRIHRGQPLPEELRGAPWGSPADLVDTSSDATGGLRMAWLLEPNERMQAYGSVMESRVLFHNTSREAVYFATEDWIQSGMHSAKDANGKSITVSAIQRLGERTRMVFRLAPGEYTEVKGHSIGIGSRETESNSGTLRMAA